MDKKIPVIIPAYEPDDRLLHLIKKMVKNDMYVVIVDDGSGKEYQDIFSSVLEILAEKGTVLHHETNKGKGRALKTAFSFILEHIPEAIGVITADSDGQHTIESIQKVKDVFMNNPKSLILGVRHFNKHEIPWKSYLGNILTINIFSYVAGVKISDTQTGLRGIPIRFVEELITVQGERFEFETEMLIEASQKYDIVETEIETVYDSKEEHKTHFDPFADSIKIYAVLGKRLFKYIFASFSSSIIDLLIFALICHYGRYGNSISYVGIATIVARIFSATYNYIMNYKVVFNSTERHGRAFFRYAVLAVVQMGCSAFFTMLLVLMFGRNKEIFAKIFVDILLFFVSYKIQQLFVFKTQDKQRY